MKASLPVQIPVEETFRFVGSALPPSARRVLEVGCGRGELAARLGAKGLQVTALDRSEENVVAARALGVDANRVDFLGFEDVPFDAALFTRSLHHMEFLVRAVEHACDLLMPGALVIAEEFAVERMDRETARWFYELRSLLEAAGVLASAEADAPLTAGPLERWYEEHASQEPLHEGEEMLVALGSRFDVLRSENAPYLYRYVCEHLEPSDRGVRVAQWVLELESLRVAERSLAPVGLRIVARKTR